MAWYDAISKLSESRDAARRETFNPFQIGRNIASAIHAPREAASYDRMREAISYSPYTLKQKQATTLFNEGGRGGSGGSGPSAADILAQKQLNAQLSLPGFDISGARARAKQSTSGNVNAYVDEMYNTFKKSMDARRSLKQQKYDLGIDSLNKDLENFIKTSETTGARTTEDAALVTGQTKEDEGTRQLTEARMADATQRGAQEEVASQGLSFSGLGKQKLGEVKTQRSETEQAQTKGVDRALANTEKLKTRTLADLASGQAYKKTTTEATRKAAKIDLDEEFQNLIDEDTQALRNRETTREAKQKEATEAALNVEYEGYLNKLKDPYQQSAAFSRYGGYLRG